MFFVQKNAFISLNIWWKQEIFIPLQQISKQIKLFYKL